MNSLGDSLSTQQRWFAQVIKIEYRPVRSGGAGGAAAPLHKI